MDYRKFLDKTETLVLPYLGGARVDAETRRLRVTRAVEPGWWRFTVKGREATPTEKVDAPELGHLERIRGHFAEGWLFESGKRHGRVELCLDEPAVFSLLAVRRWPSDDWLFDSVEFESEAEEEVRRALEDNRSLGDIKGVAASLRAAFGFAMIAGLARREQTRVSPYEVSAHSLAIADGGPPVAAELLRDIVETRRLERIRLEAHEATLLGRRARPQSPHASAPMRNRRGRAPTAEDAADRAALALDAAGATLLGLRVVRDYGLEVTFRFRGERFISVVDPLTLQVLDAGICLSGADREVNLDSLPSVIREAIDTDQLHITRH